MTTPITRAEVLNLIQSKPSTNGARLAKKGVCHKCNKPGHWSCECPEKNRGKGRNGSNVNERPMDVKSWKSTLPPSGAPQVKQANEKGLSTGVQAARVGPLPTPQQRTLVVSRKVLMEQMMVVLQSTTFHSLLTHRHGPPKTRLFQV
jgi:hypothetical protein